MTHGTFRNNMSRLRKEGIVEKCSHSGLAFYTLRGVRVGKPMTPNHTGGELCDPIAKIIQSLPFDKAALHNIRLLFDVRGCWKILAESGAYEPDAYSKDISLPLVPYGVLRLKPTVHRTDRVTVDVSCSGAPVVADIRGIIRLSKALTRVEERLLMRLETCSKGSAMVVIPESNSWLVTMWHFGRDSISEYNGKQFAAAWEIGQNELLRVYSKEFPGTDRGKNKTKLRLEVQQYPRSSIEQVVGNLLQL